MTKRLWTEGRQKQATDFIQNLSKAEQSCQRALRWAFKGFGDDFWGLSGT